MTDIRLDLARDLDSAFPRLIEAMRDDLYAGIRRLHPNDADDLTQETFIRAYRALTGYDTRRIRELKLRGWMWTIALNLSRNHARDRARRPTPVALDDRDATSDPEPPDSRAWDRRLGLLPRRQRQAVVMRHVVGMPYVEIAEALGVPEGTAKADVHRALQRLRTIMEAER